MTEAQREGLLEDALLAPAPRIGAHKLRPLSAGTYILLRKLKNPLIEGSGTIDIDTPAGLMAAFQFVYVHAVPVGEVLQVARDPDLLEIRVMELADGFSVDAIAEAVNAIVGETQMAAAAITEKEVPENDDEEGDDPNGRGRPGSRTAFSKSRPRRAGRGITSPGS